MEGIFMQEQQKDGQFLDQYGTIKHSYTEKIGYLFVPKFYHEQRPGFTSIFRYIGKVQPNGEHSKYGRVLYIYEPTTAQIYTISDSTLQWIFLDKYSKTIGLSVRGFELTFPNLTSSLKNLLEPSSGLINNETGTKETSY